MPLTEHQKIAVEDARVGKPLRPIPYEGRVKGRSRLTESQRAAMEKMEKNYDNARARIGRE